MTSTGSHRRRPHQGRLRERPVRGRASPGPAAHHGREHSVVRRAPGFDIPEFLAAGPRELLVAASDIPSRETSCARLTRVTPSHLLAHLNPS
jgi:hypothetical protein